MAEKEQNNRRLAKWVKAETVHIKIAGPLGFKHYRYLCELSTKVNGKFCTCGQFDFETLDFYTDESANALLLEKFPEPHLWLESDPATEPKYWGCMPDRGDNLTSGFDADRKTAVVLAALAQIDKEQG